MKYAVFILLSLLSVSVDAQLSLQEAVQTAINNNLDVRQSDLRARSAEVIYKQSKATRYPDLNAFANHGFNEGRSIDPFTNAFVNQRINFAGYGISSGVILFNGLNIHHSIKQNAFAFEASRNELQQAKDELTLNVILTYLLVLNNTDQLAQARSQAVATRSQAERLEIMFNEGAIAPAEFYDIRGQLASDELSIVNSRNSLNEARLQLSQLMNVPYDSTLQVQRLNLDQFSTAYEATPDEIYQIALQQLALVKAADLRKESAARAVKAARGSLYPTLSLTGNLNTNYSSAAFRDIFLNTTDVTTTDYVLVNGTKTPVIRPQSSFSSQRIPYNDQLNNNLFTSVVLGLRIPIFNAFQSRSRLKLAELDYENSTYVEQTTKVRLKQAIEQAYFNMIAARERYVTLQGQVTAFAESFRAAEIRFEEGAATSVDYVIAKNNLDRANISLISARYDFVLRTKILDYYQGKTLW